MFCTRRLSLSNQPLASVANLWRKPPPVTVSTQKDFTRAIIKHFNIGENKAAALRGLNLSPVAVGNAIGIDPRFIIKTALNLEKKLGVYLHPEFSKHNDLTLFLEKLRCCLYSMGVPYVANSLSLDSSFSNVIRIKKDAIHFLRYVCDSYDLLIEKIATLLDLCRKYVDSDSIELVGASLIVKLKPTFNDHLSIEAARNRLLEKRGITFKYLPTGSRDGSKICFDVTRGDALKFLNLVKLRERFVTISVAIP